ASRPSVMYSGRAGIVSRTERGSALISVPLPGAVVVVTQRNPQIFAEREGFVLPAARRRPFAEAHLDVPAMVAAIDGETGHIAWRERLRDRSNHVERAADRVSVDR